MNDEIVHDPDLLRQYAEGSEAAFRELVRRHLGMVHATARRILSTAPHLADDVTQGVFADLAKNAATLPAGVVLGGWLHRHTCYLALNTIRTESRRQARERTAMEINAVNDNSGQDAHWAQLAPVLDDALNNLDANDRDAIVLRYLEQHDLRRVGLTLGVSDDAAQKRVSRALEKLRGVLTNRGLTLGTTAALAGTLNADAKTTAAPPDNLHISAAKAALAVTVQLPTLRFLIMNLSKKSALSIAILLLLLGLGITIFVAQSPPASPSDSTKDASAKTNQHPPSVSPTSVEAPKIGPVTPTAGGVASATSAAGNPNPVIAAKLDRIVIPSVNIDVATPLDEVTKVLASISKAYDSASKDDPAAKVGVQIKVEPGNGPMPKIKLSGITGLSLGQELQLAGKLAGYSYTIENDTVVLRPDPAPAPITGDSSATWAKLDQISLPQVNIDLPTPLETVAQTLHDFSVNSDPEHKGVNIVVISGNNPAPKIILAAQNAPSEMHTDKGVLYSPTLHELLISACQQAGYILDVEGGVVLLEPSSGTQ